MNHIQFYAADGDLLPVLLEVEASGAINYTQMGQFHTADFPSFTSGSLIPNLGRASVESAINCTTYLVSDRSMQIQAEPFQLVSGERRVGVDQLLNPDTVTLTPAGLWNNEVMLYGRVATASGSPVSLALMKRFRSALKTHFAKVRAYYIGPAALSLLKSGHRLTIAAQSPPEFDLQL